MDVIYNETSCVRLLRAVSESSGGESGRATSHGCTGPRFPISKYFVYVREILMILIILKQAELMRPGIKGRAHTVCNLDTLD